VGVRDYDVSTPEGLLQDRNIFVVGGVVMTDVRYHKSQSQWNKPMAVPQLCAAASKGV
jgi:hypothetical protein